MKIHSKGYVDNLLCVIHNSEWLEKQRIAGKVVSQALSILKTEAHKRTGLGCSKLIETFILDNKCQPTFKGFHGFPEAVCISVNNELVHGIPKDKPFFNGDVVSFDLGATFEGAIADSAITIIIGENKKAQDLVKYTELALKEAISKVKVGAKLGVIGHSIYKTGKTYNFQVIEKYGGHFISMNKPHDSPFVSNRSDKDSGIRLQEGMSFAIEPLFCLGFSNETKTLQDNWTVVTKDLSAHFEHTIYLHKSGPEIITG